MPVFLISLLAATLSAAEPAPTTAAKWVWYPEDVVAEGVGETRYLRRVIDLPDAPTRAVVRLRADDGVVFTINGTPASEPREGGAGGSVYDLTGVLTKGRNVLAFAIFNAAGKGGLILTGEVVAGGRTVALVSDTSFRAWKAPVEGWDRPGFDDRSWPAAGVVGDAFAPPWFRHPSFDMTPFITAEELDRWRRWHQARIAVPAGLVDEQPARARFVTVNGQRCLDLDGHHRPALIYRGVVDPLTDHGRRQIELFRDAGVHLYCAYWPLSEVWKSDGELSFDYLDEALRAYLSADPQARVMLMMRLVPPTWWMDGHPGELVEYATGKDYNTHDEAGRVRRPSFASAAWRDDTRRVWRRTIEHLEAQPWGKRIIAYLPVNGIYGEWHYYGSWAGEMPDTGPAMTRYFRDWLRRKYGEVGRLRAAWGEPAAEFDTATVPGVRDRLTAGVLGLREPVAQGRVIDYYRCQQAVTAEDIEAFCAAAKEATGGRALTGTFYGYYEGVHPQNQGGHLELARVLASPSVDLLSAPYSYSHRLMGDDGRLRVAAQAYSLAGKTHVVEADTRTFLHPRNEHGRLPDEGASVAAIRREVATALIDRCGLWWCDFGPGLNGGWYDRPALIGEVARMVRFAAERLKRPAEPVAQVALIADPPSCTYLEDGQAMRAHLNLVGGTLDSLYRSGAPFDFFLLDQLGQADLSRYKLLVFLDTLCVTPELRPVVARAVAGRSVLWLWSPGITDGRRMDPSLTADLTGFKVALDGGVVAGEAVTESRHALLAGLPATARYRFTTRARRPVADAGQAESWFNPRTAKVMEEAYVTYEVTAAGGALHWKLATRHAWSDIHLKTGELRGDAVGARFAATGSLLGKSLRLVVKCADGEFVGERVALTAQPKERVYPLAGLDRAPRSKGERDRPTLPLTGLKLVVDGLAGPQSGELIVSDLAMLDGEATRVSVVRVAETAVTVPCLTIDPVGCTPLGHDPETRRTLVAARGEPGRRQILSVLPAVSRQLLVNLMDDAGVHRYVAGQEVIVRADSDLLSLHTAVGGRYELRLPKAERLTDGLTGKVVGLGTTVTIDLPPNSTTLLLRQAP